MFTTAHLTSGLALALALGLDGVAFWAVVLASVFTDWDYSLQLLSGRNHRTFLSHSPPVIAATLGLAGFAWPVAWWLLAGAMLHLALDVLDAGVRWNPLSPRTRGMGLLGVADDASFPTYIRHYFADRRFLAAELALAAAAAALALWRL